MPALKQQIEEATRRGETAGALALARRWVELTETEHVEALYAAAQRRARAADREQAYLLLARAMGTGFPDRGRLLEDEAFAAYRNEDLFRSLARKAWANGYIGLLERDNREDVQKSPRILVIIDYTPKPMSERPWGPPPEQQFPREQLDSEMAGAGFRVAACDFLPEQFFVIYVAR